MQQTKRPFLPGQVGISVATASRRYRRLLPRVYIDKDVQVTAYVSACAAWLWAGGDCVLSGVSAAAVHKARWLPAAPAEVVTMKRVRAAGVNAHRDTLQPGDITRVDGMRVTSPVRTAFDLARRYPLDDAVAMVDALLQASYFPPERLLKYVQDRGGCRGKAQALLVAQLVNNGAESPRETALRLLILRAGLPRPTTQFAICGYRLDLAWPQFKVAVEYDGAHHFTEAQARKDARRDWELRKRGWTVLRVNAGIFHEPADLLAQVRAALRRNGAPV